MYLIPFLLIYALPFLIAQAMPGRKSLVVLAVLGGGSLVALWIAFDRALSEASGGEGFGIVFVLGLVLMLGLGLLSGVLVRTLKLTVFKTDGARLRNALVVSTGFLLPLGLVTLQHQWQQWQTAMPTEKCLSRSHVVTVAGATYRLPSAPLFTVWLAEDKIFSFDIHARLRDFCDEGSSVRQPIHAVLLSLDIERFGYGPVRDRFCQAPASRWGQALCRNDPAVAARYPVKAKLAAPDELDPRLVDRMGAYATFVRERDQAQAIQQPLTKEVKGVFEHYSNHYWVAREKRWLNPAGEPFTLRCIPASGQLYCRTLYRLNNGPQLSYDFRAREAELEATARAMDRQMRRMLEELALPR